MTEQQIRQIATAIAEAMREEVGLSAQEHREHHDAIRRFIERDNRRAEMLHRVKSSVAGWLVLTILGGIGVAVWEFLKIKMRVM